MTRIRIVVDRDGPLYRAYAETPSGEFVLVTNDMLDYCEGVATDVKKLLCKCGLDAWIDNQARAKGARP